MAKSKNAKKAKGSQAQAPKGGKKAGKSRRRNRGVAGGMEADTMVECIYGPVSQMLKSKGVPDGSQKPSFVMDHLQFLTPSPDSDGAIQFMLIPGSQGGLAISRGKWTVTVPEIDASTGDIRSWKTVLYDTGVAGATRFVSWWYDWAQNDNHPAFVVAFNELQTGGSYSTTHGLLPHEAFGVEAYRVITNAALVSYTGSALNNSGVTAVARAELHIEKYSTDSTSNDVIPIEAIPIGGAIMAQVCTEGLVGQGNVVAMPGSVVLPATKGAKLLNVPTGWEYRPVTYAYNAITSAEHTVGTAQVKSSCAFQQLAVLYKPGDPDHEKFFGISCSGFGNAPYTEFFATGMAADASLAITAKTCIEWAVRRGSPMLRLAGPSPEPKPLVIQTVAALAPKIPAAAASDGHDHGWLGNALEWYGGAMKKIVGGVYSIGGKVMSQVFKGTPAGALGQGIGALGNQMSQLSIGY